MGYNECQECIDTKRATGNNNNAPNSLGEKRTAAPVKFSPQTLQSGINSNVSLCFIRWRHTRETAPLYSIERVTSHGVACLVQFGLYLKSLARH